MTAISDYNLIQRDAAMISLIAHAQNLTTRLAMMTQAEKEAVLALVVIGQAMAGYTRGVQPDGEVIESFMRMLESLSPEGMRRLAPQARLYACPREQAGSEAVDEAGCLTTQLRDLYAQLVPPLRTAEANDESRMRVTE